MLDGQGPPLVHSFPSFDPESFLAAMINYARHTTTMQFEFCNAHKPGSQAGGGFITMG